MKGLFKFKNKYEKLGIILGCICFMPSFIIAIKMCIIPSFLIGVILLGITQTLWLLSISFCLMSLETENKELKEKLREM